MSKMFKWGSLRSKLTKWGIIIGVPIISISIILSLCVYVRTWYFGQQLIIINVQNVSSYMIFIVSILMSSLINLGLVIYYSRSLKRVEKLVSENCNLSEMLIAYQIKSNEEIKELIKGGVNVD